MSNPTELRARASDLESRVPPVTAGPRTDDERMWLEKAAALRAEADRLEAAGQFVTDRVNELRESIRANRPEPIDDAPLRDAVARQDSAMRDNREPTDRTTEK